MNSFFYASYSNIFYSIWIFYVYNVHYTRLLNLYIRKLKNTKMKTLTLTEEQIKLLADAVWMRQRCFIAGDKRFKEYGTMLETILDDVDYTPSRY